MEKKQPYFGMMVNCFCGMVYRRKALSLISSRGHCQRFSSSQIFDMPQAKLKSGLNLSSGFEERSYAVVINEFMMYGYLSSLHRIGFVAFSHAMRNWWEYPCNSPVIKIGMTVTVCFQRKAVLQNRKYSHIFYSQ